MKQINKLKFYSIYFSLNKLSVYLDQYQSLFLQRYHRLRHFAAAVLQHRLVDNHTRCARYNCGSLDDRRAGVVAVSQGNRALLNAGPLVATGCHSAPALSNNCPTAIAREFQSWPPLARQLNTIGHRHHCQQNVQNRRHHAGKHQHTTQTTAHRRLVVGTAAGFHPGLVADSSQPNAQIGDYWPEGQHHLHLLASETVGGELQREERVDASQT